MWYILIYMAHLFYFNDLNSELNFLLHNNQKKKTNF